MDLFLTNMQLLSSQDTDGLEWCGLLVDYCDVFISCLDSHSDGTHSLQSIHCWDTDGMLNFFKSEETNKLIYILDGLRMTTFLFWTPSYRLQNEHTPCKWGQTMVDFNKNRFTHHWCGTLSLWCLQLHLHCICSRLFTTFIHTDGHEDRLRSVFVAHEDAVVPRVLHGHVVYSESGGFILVFNVILAVEVTSLSFFSQNISGTGSPSAKHVRQRDYRERENQCLLLMWAEWDTAEWWMDVTLFSIIATTSGRPFVTRARSVRWTLWWSVSSTLSNCFIKTQKSDKQILTFLSKTQPACEWGKTPHYIDNERTNVTWNTTKSVLV